MSTTIQNVQNLVLWFDNYLEKSQCCRSLYCSTCGGVYNAIKSKMTDEIEFLLHSVMSNISREQLINFEYYTPLIEALEPKRYNQIIRKEIHQIDQNNISEVDHFLIKARHYYSLDEELFYKFIERAIKLSVSTKNKSLCETLIIVLKNDIVNYPQIVDLALGIAITDKQMQRALFNCVREVLPEVRRFSCEAEGNYCAGDLFPTIYTTKELSKIYEDYKSNMTNLK